MRLRNLVITLSLIAILALLATTLFSCSDESDSTNTTAATAEATTAAAADDKTYEFKLSHHEAANSVKDKFMSEWAAQVAAATDGRVKVTVYPGAILGNTMDGLNMVRSGICDILWSFTGFFSGEFDATDVLSLPLLGIRTAEESVGVYWDLFESMPDIEEEFAGLKVLNLYCHPGSVVGTNKLVDTVDDLKGLKMRIPAGPTTDVFVEWGVSPVSLPAGDIYQALEKNVVDGYSFDWAGVEAFKVHEPIDYFLDLKLYIGPMFIVMNQDSWNKLPADLQETMATLIGRDFSYAFAQNQDAVVEEFIPRLISMGKTVTVPTDEARAGFKVGADKIVGKWVKDMDAKGYDGTGLYNKALELVEKYVTE